MRFLSVRLLSFRVVMALVVVISALGSLLVAEATIISDYKVTQVTVAQMPKLPNDHWAHYDTICATSSPSQMWTNSAMLRQVFPPLSQDGAEVPFFAWENVSLYVNDMGFLSPTPYGMCEGFCRHDFFANLEGDYAFSANASELYGMGGDWPMISFYAAPFKLDPNAAQHGFIVALEPAADSSGNAAATPVAASSGSPASVRHVILEYCNVPILTSSPTQDASLTAQVVVYTNGTIVMRYARLPDPALLPEIVRSTGLVYSKALRKVVTTPTAANGIVAYRFDPVYDVCGAPATEAACLGVAGGDCAWCGSTGACASTSIVSEVCPRGQWSTAGSASASSAGSSPPPQKFYRVQVSAKGTMVTFSGAPLNVYGNSYFTVVNDWDTILFNYYSGSNLLCTEGFTCQYLAYSDNCNPIENTCPNGNYTISILAADSKIFWTTSAQLRSRTVPQRAKGGLLCDETTCSQGVVLKMSGLAFRNGRDMRVGFYVQLYIDNGGVVDITVYAAQMSDGTPLLTFPSLRVGLVRHGVDDASSVMIPQGLLRSGVRARFVPVTACGDCGEHGWCDESTGACHCRPGYFGTTCAACPVCWTGSQCDDGIGGSGTCLCSGGACAAACPGTSSAALDGSCGGCEAAGGRCDCGQCVCSGGWGGPNCDVAPVDACVAYSLDGCEVCGQHEGCEFCFDSTCFNPALSGTAGGYTCSYSTPAADTVACVTYASRGVTPNIYYVYSASVAGCVLLVTGVMALLTVFMFCWTCTQRRVSDVLVNIAVGGAPGFRNTRVEREVIQVRFMRQRVPRGAVMAIPLRQISLRRLFKQWRSEVVVGGDEGIPHFRRTER